MKQRPRYTVDATDGDCYTGFSGGNPFGLTPPYAVHDSDRQDWIAAGLRRLWQARLIAWIFNKLENRRSTNAEANPYRQGDSRT